MNRLSLVSWALLALTATCQAQNHSTERLIKAAQDMPVQDLDAALPRIPLSAWLASVAGQPAKVAWEVNDCGEQTGGPADKGRDFPACVEASFLVAPGSQAHVSVIVGTFERGIVGRPEQRHLYVERAGALQHLTKLSELQALRAMNE